MSRDNDAYTHPNPKRAGIAASWRNSNGSRPRNPRVDERDRRLEILRAALAERPTMTVPSVMLMFNVKLKTAEAYLAMAKEAK